MSVHTGVASGKWRVNRDSLEFIEAEELLLQGLKPLEFGFVFRGRKPPPPKEAQGHRTEMSTE